LDRERTGPETLLRRAIRLRPETGVSFRFGPPDNKKGRREGRPLWKSNPGSSRATARRANQMVSDPRPNFLGTLAAACAAAGRFDEAVLHAQEAIALAEAAGMHAFAAETRARLERYRAGISLFEPAPEPAAGSPAGSPRSER
jgi:hypothetical protein